MNAQILIDAIKSNLNRTGNAAVIEVAMAALGHADLGHKVAADMIRLAAVRELESKQAFEFAGTVFNAGSDDDTDYSAEIAMRTNDLFETIAAVNAALGFDVEG